MDILKTIMSFPLPTEMNNAIYHQYLALDNYAVMRKLTRKIYMPWALCLNSKPCRMYDYYQPEVPAVYVESFILYDIVNGKQTLKYYREVIKKSIHDVMTTRFWRKNMRYKVADNRHNRDYYADMSLCNGFAGMLTKRKRNIIMMCRHYWEEEI